MNNHTTPNNALLQSITPATKARVLESIYPNEQICYADEITHNLTRVKVSVHPPCLYPGSEAILAAISADETSALPGGSERLRVKRVLTGLSKLGAQDEGDDQITGELAMALSELLEQQIDISIALLHGSIYDNKEAA